MAQQTAREKAQELVHKYITLTDGWVYGKENWEHKKKCALISVDEILNLDNFSVEGRQYWSEVKTEIEKL